jgi:hypothetical protein
MSIELPAKLIASGLPVESLVVEIVVNACRTSLVTVAIPEVLREGDDASRPRCRWSAETEC